jgi:hypothetical protein
MKKSEAGPEHFDASRTVEMELASKMASLC